MIFAIDNVLVATREKGEQIISDGEICLLNSRHLNAEMTLSSGGGVHFSSFSPPRYPLTCDNRGLNMYNTIKAIKILKENLCVHVS